MKRAHFFALGSLAAVALAAGACHPDQPTTSPPASPLATTKAAVARPPASPADTLHLPGGVVAQLRPSTAALFNRLPTSTLPNLPNDPAAEPLAAVQGQVRRQGRNLWLKPAQGGEVRFSSTPEAQFTLQNAKGVHYMY